VIRAAQAIIVGYAELQIDQTVQTAVTDQAQPAFFVPIENDVFA
jgi:hypothetical protein